MQRYIIQTVLPYTLLLIAISGVTGCFTFKIPLIITWGINTSICILYYWSKKFIKTDNNLLINYYLYWNIFCLIRGCFVAEIYWDWKTLIDTGFCMVLPVFYYTFSQPNILSLLLKNLLKYSFIIFPIILIGTISSDIPGRYLTFIYIYCICINIIPKKWRIIFLILGLFSIFYDLDARSNGIRAIIALLIGVFAFYIIDNTIIKRLALFTFLIPFILFILGAFNIFNIFKMDEYMQEINISQKNPSLNDKSDANLTADTRTFLYKEVISSAISHNYILYGRTPSRGYTSYYFTFDDTASANDGIRKNERYRCEVSILNIFHNSGIIGVIFYFLIFFKASYLALFKSQNKFIKLFGLFIAFRWCYGWIEDFNNFDINYIILWIILSMCFSKKFRVMNNTEFKLWINKTLP